MKASQKRALIKTLERHLELIHTEFEPNQMNLRKAAVIFSKIERLKGAKR